MALNTIEFLHREHQEWLNDSKHWDHELDFLDNMLEKVKNKSNLGESQKKGIGELQNQILHHKKFLSNMIADINSHESFIKDMMDDDTIIDEEDFSDHEKHRKHVASFKQKIKDLRFDIFRLAENILN